MIIPVRCFSCGKPIAHLWETYIEKVQEGYKKPIESTFRTSYLQRGLQVNTIKKHSLCTRNVQGILVPI